MDPTESSNGGEFVSDEIPWGNMSNNDFSLPRSLVLEASDALLLYIRPIVMIVGILGNMLSLLLMQQPSMKKSSTSVYFSTLSIADTVYLLSYGVTDWLLLAFDYKPWERNDVVCKLKAAVIFAALSTSGWTVVALSFERVVVVLFPLKATILCTRRTAYIATSSNACTFTCLWVGVLFGWGVSFKGKCDNDAVVSFLFHGGGLWFVWSMDTAVPIPLLVAANGVLMYGLIQSKRQRSALVGGIQTGGNPATKKNKATSRATVSVFLVSVIHVILTVPIAVTFFPDMAVAQTDLWSLVAELGTVFRLINHSANLFLYLLTMPKIRSELHELFCCNRQPQRPI